MFSQDPFQSTRPNQIPSSKKSCFLLFRNEDVLLSENPEMDNEVKRL